MVVPVMTQENSAYNANNSRVRRNDSIIGLIVWYNILQIRQRLIDEYWWNRLLERDLKSGEHVETVRYLNAKKRKKFLHDVTPLINEELGPLSYFPEVGVALPPSIKTKKDFADATGIDEQRFNELNSRNQIPDVEELVAIARLGDVDISYMFMPTMDILDADRKIVLKPIDGQVYEVEAHRWVLWVRSMMHLPGQLGKKYLQETAIPSKKRMTADGKSARSYAEIEKELKDRTLASTSAIKAIADELEKNSKISGLQINSLNPFNTGKLIEGYSSARGKGITLRTNLIMAQSRKLLSLSSNRTSNKENLKKRFVDGIEDLQGSIFQLMQLLRITKS